MATQYPVKIDVQLRPIWHDDPPEINIGIDDDVQQIILTDNQRFHYEFMADNTSTLSIELLNKTDADTCPDKGLDKAVIIESISFFDIADNLFIWAGEYCPDYPEPWYSEQIIKPEPLLKNHTYLSWNGKWRLTFTVPVFTWIHNTQNLGWIYD
jgi:hypothetical protein